MAINQAENSLESNVGEWNQWWVLSKTKSYLVWAAMMALSSVWLADEWKQIELPENVWQKVESLLANPYGISMSVWSEKWTYFIERIGNSVKVTTPKKEVFYVWEGEYITAPDFMSDKTQSSKVSITPNPSWLWISYNRWDTIMSWNAWYSKLYWATVEWQIAWKISDNVAWAIALEWGEKLQRVLWTLGFSFNNSVLTVSWEWKYVKQKFSFTSWDLEERVRQNKLWVALKIRLDSKMINELIISGSITDAQSKDLENKEITIDNETMFAIYDNYRRIAWWKLIEWSVGWLFKLSVDTNLQLNLTYEKLMWDDKYTYMPDKSWVWVEAKLTHKFTPSTSWYVWAKLSQTWNTYSTWLTTSNDDWWKFGVEYRYTDWQNWLPDDRYVWVKAEKRFGWPDVQTAQNQDKPNKQTSKPTNKLVQDVLDAQDRTKSWNTLHRADQKTVSILEILKAWLDEWVVILVDWTLEVAGISSIVSITKNWLTFTNWWEFSQTWNSLFINSRSFTPPFFWTDTYVIRWRDTNWFFVDVTVSVQKWSVKITWVNVVNVANEPGTINAPTLDSKTHNSINTTPWATSGMTNVRVALYNNPDLSDAHKLAENTNGDFTWLTDSTTYYIVTIWDDYNESNWVTETKKSNVLVVTTDAPPNLPGTINSPTLESKGETYVNTAPGTASGMTNIRVRMYADSWLTNLLAENITWDFVWLANGTTYYFVTVWDDYNENLKITETKRSTPLIVTTDTSAPVNQIPPLMWTITPQSWTVWQSININLSWFITATNWDPFVCGLTWNLPNWTSFNSGTCSITWTPTESWVFNLTLVWTDDDWNSADWSFTLTIDAAPNQAPVASDWSFDAWWNWFVNIDFWPLVSDDNDSDSQLTFEVVSNPSNLSISWTFPNITVTATWWFGGDTYFTYTVKDSLDLSSEVKKIDVIDISN